MRAAQASEDPVTVGASARIITHTLMNGHHLAAAIATASTHAAQLDHDIAPTRPNRCPSTGRCCCAARSPPPSTTTATPPTNCSAEAEDAAQRLGVDGNLRWTAFGPTNATLHRSTSPSPSATREPRSTWPAAST